MHNQVFQGNSMSVCALYWFLVILCDRCRLRISCHAHDPKKNLVGNLVGNSSIFDLLSGEPKISMTATVKQKPRQKLSNENIAHNEHNECEIKRDDKSDTVMGMGMMRAATRDRTLFGRH